MASAPGAKVGSAGKSRRCTLDWHGESCYETDQSVLWSTVEQRRPSGKTSLLGIGTFLLRPRAVIDSAGETG